MMPFSKFLSLLCISNSLTMENMTRDITPKWFPIWHAMLTLLSPHYNAQEVTRGDLVIASAAFGFTLGFGWLTAFKAIRQTWQVYQRHGRRVFRNAYIIMVWGELTVCTIFMVICILHLLGVIPPRLVVPYWAMRMFTDINYSFAFYFTIREFSVSSIWILLTASQLRHGLFRYEFQSHPREPPKLTLSR